MWSSTPRESGSDSMIHLAGVRYVPPEGKGGYPFSIPLVQSLAELEFDAPVTVLVGENGSGKSTLLEALAVGAGCTSIGSESLTTDRTLAAARELARHLRLSWKKRTHRGFFLRAEDFFAFCNRVNDLRAEMEEGLRTVDEEFADRSILARQLARGVYQGSIGALQRRYGEDMHAQSHGESFLKLFQSRFVPGGLYVLDEPEAPLSPTRQLALIAMMKEMVESDCQFIMATHSPILMAYPGATVLSCDEQPVRRVAYEELEHVRVTKAFLNNPESFLRRL